MRLYEITDEIKALDELFLMGIDEETGEVKDGEILEQLENEIKTVLAEKSVNLIRFMKNDEAYIEIIKKEEERLKKLRKSIENKQEYFKKYVLSNMQKAGIKKIETELGNFSLRSSESVEVYDEKLIDKKFITEKVEVKISKTDIKKAIKNGEEVQGARIVSNINLNIK